MGQTLMILAVAGSAQILLAVPGQLPELLAGLEQQANSNPR
jgi:hypothetical protein